jgi:hypothetical protein
MKRLLLAFLCATSVVSLASADSIDLFAVTGSTSTLTLSPVIPGGNQPKNHPCLICGTQQPAQPTGFGYNNFDATGNVSNYLMFSTATVGGSLGQDVVGTGYSLGSGAFLAALAGNTTFSVGIDVNDTTVAQTLESFYFLNLTQHTVLASFSPGPGGVPILAPNNGTGFPDWTLTGFDINRGDIALGDQIIFFARWSGANDGPESFFLVPNVVPGPLAGAGIPGLIAAMGGLTWLARRRRNKTLVAN